MPDLCMSKRVQCNRHRIVHRLFHAIAVSVRWNCRTDTRNRDKCTSSERQPSRHRSKSRELRPFVMA